MRRGDQEVIHDCLSALGEPESRAGRHNIYLCEVCAKPKLYVNRETGFWDCKVCGDEGGSYLLAKRCNVPAFEDDVQQAATIDFDAHRAAIDELKHRRGFKNTKGRDLQTTAERCRLLLTHEKCAKAKQYLNDRGLTDDTIYHFQLGAGRWYGKDQRSFRSICVEIPYIDSGKIRLVKTRRVPAPYGPQSTDDKQMRVKGGQDALYNAEAIRGQEQVILVEGEFDCMALSQMGIPNAASTSLGAKGFSDEWLEDLKDATEIILIYDNDKAGREGAEKILPKLGRRRCKILSLIPDAAYWGVTEDIEDFADLLKQNVDHQRVKDEIAKAKPIKVVRATHISDLLDDAYNKISAHLHRSSLNMGLPSLDEAIGGLSGGRLTLVLGNTGHGKTALMTTIAKNIASSNVGVFFAPQEETDDNKRIRLLGSLMGQKVVVGGEIVVDRNRIDKTVAQSSGCRMFIHPNQGTRPLSELLSTLEEEVKLNEVKVAMLDHLKLVSGDRPGNIPEHQWLADNAQRIKDFAIEHNIHIFLGQHVNTGPMQIAGEGDIRASKESGKIADNGLTIWRNTVDLLATRLRVTVGGEHALVLDAVPGDVYVNIWKNRDNGGNLGLVKLRYLDDKQMITANETDFL